MVQISGYQLWSAKSVETGPLKMEKQPNGKQRYYCSICKASFQHEYRYQAYSADINDRLILLLKSCVGVNDISRILNISKNTVLDRILKIAGTITKPKNREIDQEYEIDEMRILLTSKETES